MKNHKIKLRKQILKQRQALSVTEWQTKNSQICYNLKKHPLFIEAKTILAYFSYRQEPDLSSLFKEKQWGFPRCLNNSLNWHFWQPPQLLEANQYNILEPLTTSPKIQPQQVDLILVPTLACDNSGYRLGYGGGYYDRFLNNSLWQNIPTIGIVFNFAYLIQLPIEPWDIKLNYICTESSLVEH
ncbi:5-formyltetrahydrofolate cyclo-ligase [Hyella patelloides LEGE 07179]|uniref:5-formyltetrahydrofolate cyclo-ligase n=1 Tax=Hyella patelloides LEGE 07179 TaxID=945734 RepID=A0A563VRC2_9CYAN|nr:5-formyltetrahydrofolate cyclo-ligase [Hyella patelloides]VEP13817.1 5-formyltetrahydrofolate cyclo-ligase [Hyella patelloides LEGE 07179]